MDETKGEMMTTEEHGQAQKSINSQLQQQQDRLPKQGNIPSDLEDDVAKKSDELAKESDRLGLLAGIRAKLKRAKG